MDPLTALAIVWLCLFATWYVAQHPAPCDNPTCRVVHRVHQERERLEEIAHHHDWHTVPHPECDRCERGEPRE